MKPRFRKLALKRGAITAINGDVLTNCVRAVGHPDRTHLAVDRSAVVAKGLGNQMSSGLQVGTEIQGFFH